jgi:6-phosphogluconolactonase
MINKNLFLKSFLFSLPLLFSVRANCQKYFLFIGTYTNSGSKGIYVYSFDAATGKATWLSNTDGIVNPSYLAIAPNNSFLYSCTETSTVNAGGVSAFRFNRNNGKLTFINKQTSGGDNPAYVAVHKSGRWVVAGNYSGGNLAAFPVNKNGSLQPYSQLIQHTGKGMNALRQEKPHVHSTVFSPKGNHLFVADLGLDKIMIYKFNALAKQPLHPATPAFVSTDAGSGPRHFIFHPGKKYAYLIEEMGGEVVAYKYKNGRLEVIQKIATHSDTAKGEFGSADIHISPDGKFLYASNRGSENNIAIFSVNDETGLLTLKGLQSTMGIKPRNFTIDPSGAYLLAANQQTNNIVIFKRDIVTGLLQYTGNQINIPEPVCLQMIK